MIAVGFDISEIVNINIYTKEQLSLLTQYVVEQTTEKIYEKIRDYASNLQSTREDYLNGLNKQIGEYSGIVTLSGELALMVENGSPSFDMKTAFAKSSKRKPTKKGGWYLTIPFRHGTPNTIGEQFATKQGGMPKEIYGTVKDFGSQGSTKKALTLSDLQDIDNKNATAFAQKMSNQNSGYVHKAPIHQGMIRIGQPSETKKGTQGNYFTFRRVSDKTLKNDKNSWIHKGITARKYFDKAVSDTDINEFAELIIYKFLNSQE